MLPTLDQRVRAAIHGHNMLQPGDVVGVGVSGGADSVSLLFLLEEIRESLGIRIVVLHFNHGLRGAESDADEQFVSELARKHGLEFISGRENVAARARETRANLEDAARKCRYDFFDGLVREGRITRVCVGHTADDQAETLLAKMIRGTGPAGLAGVYPVAGNVVRPLIAIRRGELREYLVERGQQWREDATNLDETRLRARVRSRLLPMLEQDFQPAIVSHLGQLANLAREDEAFWTALIEERFQSLVQREGDSLCISVEDLLFPLDLGPAIPRGAGNLGALTTRLIRRILAELKGGRLGFTSRHVEDILHLASVSTSGHQIHLPYGIIVERNFEELAFSARGLRGAVNLGKAVLREPEYQRIISLEVPQDQSVDIPEIGLRLWLKVIDWPAGARDTKLDETVADWNHLRSPVLVRSWRSGDTFKLQGRQRHRKLKQLLRERRIAVRDRCGLPVLTSAGNVVWARGFPVAQGYETSEETRKGLVISEEPL